MKKSILGLLLIIGVSSALLANERFVRDDAKEVVVDTKTNLMWQDNADAKTIKKSWNYAIDYCENLTLSGYSDWHLPNRNELYGIADRNRYNPAINPIFQNVVSNYYLSSSTFVIDTSYAWAVNFHDGDGGWDHKSYSYYVRCVRDND